MVGVTSYGIYLPLWRLPLNLISPGLKGEKAVTGVDEDSVTMAVADCRLGFPGTSLEMFLGDGAAAVLIGEDEVLAGFDGSFWPKGEAMM